MNMCSLNAVWYIGSDLKNNNRCSKRYRVKKKGMKISSLSLDSNIECFIKEDTELA